MKRFYGLVCKIEELFVQWALVIVAVLIFVSALARSVNKPLNWGMDISLLLFAWIIFLGADIALRHGDFINVDAVLQKFPEKIETFFMIVWNVLIVIFLVILIWFGIPLAIESSDRIFNTLGISYSWATLSVPVGAFLMIITLSIKTYNLIRKQEV